MAYFVSSLSRFYNEVENALRKHFGDKVEVNREPGDLRTMIFSVQVDFHAGYVREETRLTEQEIADGVIGGGVIEAIDGKTFNIYLTPKNENE